jgi:GNAT superfamily N-acetyltransferase
MVPATDALRAIYRLHFYAFLDRTTGSSAQPSKRSRSALTVRRDMTTGSPEKQFSIEVLHETSSSIERVAQWLNDEWGRDQGYSYRDTLSWCRNVASMKNELIFCANWAARPVGAVLMVACDLPSHRQFSPWLSSLFVLPEYRRHGIGRSLIERLCATARERGHAEVYLHALEGPLIPFYHRSGWSSIETVELARREFVVMRKTLQPTD